ncbi:MAG: PQQ-dependent sugar dehydrogenase [Ilumatobacteraceae bacterium]
MRRKPLHFPIALAICMMATDGLMTASTAAAAPRPQAVVSVAGFTDSLVGSVSAPVAVSALPDGRAVVLEKGGSARIVRNGALLATPALTLDVCTESERGLLGLAPDPAFGANGFVYVYYTLPTSPSTCVNRVSRFTMTGDTIAPSSELVLVDNIGSPCGNHNGGDVTIGADGYLYISVGDGGCDPRDTSQRAGANDAAQDLSLLNGKILRVVRSTGLPAPGNPISGVGTVSCRTRGNTVATPTTKCQELFAWGLRNPWRFAADPNTGATRLFANDVGQGTREEVDQLRLGANYGWPVREGVCPQGQNPPCGATDRRYVDPITDYPRRFGSYVTGGAFVPHGAWGQAFEGSYLFADGGSGQIYRRTAGGSVNYSAPFATGAGGISDMDFVMEGAGWSLLYVSPQTGEVRRIRQNQSAAPSSVPLHYVPISPTRVYDTRSLGTASGAVRAGSSRLVRLSATQGQHRAALVNVTVLRPASGAVVTLWAPGTRRPATWTMIGASGEVTTNAAIVPVDARGRVVLFSSATTHVAVDVVGWYDVAAGGNATSGRFRPVTPVRAVDTRAAASATNRYTRTASGSGSVVNVPVAGRNGIAASSGSVALFVTAVAGSPSSLGSVVGAAHGVAPRLPQVITNRANDVRGNMVVVPIGADGSVDLHLGGGVTHVLVDVLGAFTGATAPSSSAGTFVSVALRREVDTRSSIGLARLAAGGTGTVNPAAAPATAIAVAQAVTMVRVGGAGNVRLYPSTAAAPVSTSGHATAAGQTRSAGTITRLGAGTERAGASVAMDLVIGVTGWYRP